MRRVFPLGSQASYTSTSKPRSINSWAALSPATPLPSTTTFCAIAAPPGPVWLAMLPLHERLRLDR
jgi:hypothetical protein